MPFSRWPQRRIARQGWRLYRAGRTADGLCEIVQRARVDRSLLISCNNARTGGVGRRAPVRCGAEKAPDGRGTRSTGHASRQVSCRRRLHDVDMSSWWLILITGYDRLHSPIKDSSCQQVYSRLVEDARYLSNAGLGLFLKAFDGR